MSALVRSAERTLGQRLSDERHGEQSTDEQHDAWPRDDRDPRKQEQRDQRCNQEGLKLVRGNTHQRRDSAPGDGGEQCPVVVGEPGQFRTGEGIAESVVEIADESSPGEVTAPRDQDGHE